MEKTWIFSRLMEGTATDYLFVTGNPLSVKRFFRSPGKNVYVKICGVRNEAEASAAIASGADALGFNLYPGSRRFLDLRRAENWIRQLPAEISRIAVVANPATKDVLALIENDTFDAVQIHGDESPEFFKKIPLDAKPLIKAFQVKDGASLEKAELYPVFAFLLDNYRAGSLGGTGEPFDWSVAHTLTLTRPVLVAGGLTAENVGTAIRLFRPHAVDVASGVENSQGCKEESKIRQFVRAAKLAIKQVRTEDLTETEELIEQKKAKEAKEAKAAATGDEKAGSCSQGG